jgi:AcrR family transcriptional regulator
MTSADSILSAATDLFRERGLAFTMQDLADRLHISKKTIYKEYPSKESLLLSLTEYGFNRIQNCKKAILNSSMSLSEKLGAALIALPDDYQTLDFRRLGELGEKYPSVLDSIMRNLKSGWEPIFALLDQGIQTGLFRPVPHLVLQQVVTSSIDAFLDGRSLHQAGLTYQEALESLSIILMKGICI